jgi:hypothetical protein
VFGEFKLLVLLHDGETKSYLARHPAFDRTVLLHLLPKQDSPERTQVMDYLDRLTPEGRKLVLDRGELDGTTYLVTQRRLDFKNLLEWLERITPPAYRMPSPPPQEPPAAQTERAPGEFTRMFAPSTLPAVTPSPSVDPGPQPKPTQPGSFTKAFQAISKPDSPTQPFETPIPPPRSGSTQPGEFTRMFQSPLPPARENFDPAPAVRKPETSARPPFQQAGEFTRVFGQTAPPSPPPAPPPDTAKPEPADEFRDLFGPPPEPAVEPAPPPATAQAAPQPAAAQPKPAPSSNLPIILILIVLVVTAVVLIAYFVLRRSAT